MDIDTPNTELEQFQVEFDNASEGNIDPAAAVALYRKIIFSGDSPSPHSSSNALTTEGVPCHAFVGSGLEARGELSQRPKTKTFSATLTFRVAGIDGDDGIKLREKAVVHLGKTLAKQGDAGAIDTLLKELRPLFSDMSKAKAAKLVRTLIDAVAQIPDSLSLQVKMTEESIAWTVEEKRTFLRHRLQASVFSLFMLLWICDL